MLKIDKLSARYGAHPALDEVSLTVAVGEIVVILGANGAGKSTLLRCISGICEGDVSGSVQINGKIISGLSPDTIVEHGVSLVPEGRGIFGDLSVKENLLLGAHAKRARARQSANLERVLTLFPRLSERQSQIARTMSGGEQQMVAIGRALMSSPDILLLDEPSLGLSPLLCKDLFTSLKSVRDTGIGILLVEQNARQSLAIAERGYLLENTRIVHEDSASKLITDSAVQNAYLGGTVKSATSKPAQQAEVEGAKPPTPVAVSTFTPAPIQRKSAEQLAGISIDDLVSTAARDSSAFTAVTAAALASASTEALKPEISAHGTSTQQQSSGYANHQARLKATIHEIEIAARAQPPQTAKNRARHKTTTHYKTSKPAPANATDEPPVVIEVYRPPRVEVYRRRPGGKQLERE